MTAKANETEQPKSKAELSIPESVRAGLEAIAKGIGIAVTELWTIFVRQYVVRGITEVFTGIVLCVAAYFLFPVIGLWILVPLAFAMVFFYGSIQLLGNPKYFALEDIANRISDFKNQDEMTKQAVDWYSKRYR